MHAVDTANSNQYKICIIIFTPQIFVKNSLKKTEDNILKYNSKVKPMIKKHTCDRSAKISISAFTAQQKKS